MFHPARPGKTGPQNAAGMSDLTGPLHSERLSGTGAGAKAPKGRSGESVMNRTLLIAMSVAIGVLVWSGRAVAHHGDADRYNQEVVTVSGTVVDVQMVNPHARIVFDAEENGKPVRWQAELGGPQQLIKQFGWTPSTIKAGMKLTFIGRRLKSGAPYLNLTERANIVATDTGKEIYRTANFGEKAPEGPKGTVANP
jgi:uncharacterized protein DUF6152